MLYKNNVLADLFDLPQAPPFKLWNALCDSEHPQEILAVRDNTCGGNFPVIDFLKAREISMKNILLEKQNHCHAKVLPREVKPNFSIQTDGQNLITGRGDHAHITASDVEEELQNGCLTFTFDNCDFKVHIFTYQLPSGMENRIFIFTWQDDERKGKTLVAEVYKWASQLHDEFWVFNGVKGGWRKDKAFFKAVQSAKTEDLILPDSILKDLRRDTVAFFKCQSLYESLRVPWKRGILLLGPPGNGKTGSIKVLAKTCAEIGIPTLYVQTAKTRAGPEYGLTAIFQKARSEAPCMLVLEDIETLATDETRTMLLNQLDGIELNDGVLVVATANDVSKLDAAILQRPSRFDTKYTFDLPNQNLRREFFSHWLKNKIGFAQIRVNEEDFLDFTTELAELTTGWTFAFMKELFLSILLEKASNLSSYETNASTKAPKLNAPKFSRQHFIEKVKEMQKQVLPVGIKS